MSDDKKMSRLISRSLLRDLSPAESAAIEKHVDKNTESRKFAELSRLIQKSVAGSPGTHATLDVQDEELSNESRQRLKRTVRNAVQEKLSRSQSGSSGQRVHDASGNPEPPDAQSKQSQRNLDPHRRPEKRETIGRYNLIRLLRQTDTRNTWVARDEQLDRPVAIVELSMAALDSPQAWADFQREAEIMAFLEHPSIPPLYHYGVERKSGEPFYAMRFMGDQTLADAIAEHHARAGGSNANREHLRPLLAVLLETCQAIEFAHSQGIIHRDLAAKNVSLDPSGRIMLLNWASAFVGVESELRSKLPNNNAAGGLELQPAPQAVELDSTSSSSPEQAANDDQVANRQTDIYGLGAILFAILTGHTLHPETVSIAPDFLSARKQNAVEPTSSSSVDNLDLDDLDAICLHSMAHDPDLRYNSVQQFADAIEKSIVARREN